MEGLFFQTSLIAAFIAGMVALFAPCCITFLLPAYLGSVFKEKEKVLLMTIVFGLGIFTVLLPAVLGIAFISQNLFRYHDTVYLLAGFLMLGVAVMSFLGLKLPMPKLAGTNIGGRTDVLSIFTLGVFSGLTSACCAPVLIGILTLTFLSPSFLGALALGGVYVLGMVTPLLLISLFLSDKMPKVTVLRKPFAQINILGKTHNLILSNIIAGIIFLFTGTLTITLTLNGQLTMERGGMFNNMVQNVTIWANSLVRGNVILNVVFLSLVVYFLYRVSKKL